MKALFPLPEGTDFMTAPGGGHDFGIITEEAANKLGVAAGPVRLQVGHPGAKGWGARHVTENPERIGRIKGLGFRDLAHFVETVGLAWLRSRTPRNRRTPIMAAMTHLRLIASRGRTAS